MLKFSFWRKWCVPILAPFIFLLWRMGFPPTPALDWNALAIDLLFFAAVFAALFVTARWRFDVLLAGLNLVLLGRWLEVLDELMVVPPLWNIGVPMLLQVSGLVITITGLVLIDHYRRDELAQMRATANELRESQAQLHELYENATDAIFTLDPAGRVLTANKTTLSLVGYARDEILGLTIADLLAPEQLSSAVELLARALATQSDLLDEQPWEYDVVRKDGARVPVEIRTRLLWRDGQIVGLQGIARDVTERQRAQEILRRREAILQAASFAAARFLKTLEWRLDLPDVLAQLGKATDVSRVYIFENFYAADRTLLWRQTFEWVAPGITPQIHNPELQAVDVVAIGAERWAIEMRQNHPIIGVIRDFPESERAPLEAQDILSLAAVPIFVDGEWWGFIGFDDCRTERVWATAEVEALHTAADTLGAAMARERMDAAFNERTRHLMLLNEVTRVAMGAANFTELMETLADRMAELFRADGCHITLWDAAARRVTPFAGFGHGKEIFFSVPPAVGETTLTESVLQAGHSIAIEDVASTRSLSPRLIARLSARAVLGLPLIAADKKLGAVIVMFDQPHRFTPDEIARGEQTAAQVSLAIAKAQSLEQAHERATQLATLNEIGHAVSTLSGLDPVLEIIYQQMRRALPLEMCYICIYDPVADRATYPLLYDDGVRYRDESNNQLTPLMRQVIETRQGVCINRSPQEMQQVSPAGLLGDKSRVSASLLYVPLIIGERVLGIMSAQSYQLDAYTPEHLALLTGISYQAAIAIENARLFDETRRHARDLALLNDIARDAMSAATLADLRRTLVDRMGELFHADACHLTQWDAATQRTLPMAMYGEWRDIFTTLPPISGEVTLTTSALKAGHALAIADLPNSPWLSRRLAQGFDMASALALPLNAGAEPLGALVIFFRAPRQFTPDEIALGEQAAAQMSLALARAAANEQAHARLARVSALREIEVAFTSTLSLLECLNLLLVHTHAQLGGDIANVFLLEPAQTALRVVAQYGAHHPELSAQLQFPVGVGAAGWIVAQGKPLYLANVHDDARWVSIEVFEKEGVVTYLGAPLMVGARVIGVLDIATRTPREFSGEEIDFFTTLANQAAVAIENSRLFEESQKRANEFAALYEMTRDLATPRELPGLLHTIVERAVGLLDARGGGGLYLCDPERRQVRCVVSYKTLRDYSGTVLQYGEGVSGTVAATGEPLVIDDYRTWAGRAPSYEEDQPFTAVVGVPIVWQGKTIGVLDVLDNVAQRRFTQADAQLLTLFANQAAAMIENARLFAETKRHADQIEKLYRVGQALNRTLDTEAILNTVIDVAMQFTGATHGCLCVVERALNRYAYRALRGFDETQVQRAHAAMIALDHGHNGRAYLTRQPVRIDDVRRSPDYVEFLPATRAELIVPMLRGGQVIGNIDLQSPQVGAFRDTDLDFLRALADQAAVALDNARLFEEVQRRAREQTIINDITRALNSTLEVRAAFFAIAEGVRALVACDRVSLALLDETRSWVTMYALDQPRAELSEGTRFPVTATAAAEDVLAGRAHLTDDLASEATVPAEKILHAAGYRSRVNLPLIVGDRPIGALNLVSRQRGHFAARQLPSLQQIANAIAIAIENTRLFEAEQARRAELASLYNLSRALADLNDTDAIMNVVTQRAVETTHVTFARLALCENDTLIVRAAHPIHGTARDLRVGRREALANLPAMRAALTHSAPVLLTLDQPGLTEFERAALLLDWARVVCVTPLQVGEQTLGCLMLGETRNEQREPFDEDKLRLARSLGDQTASALHRAELFAQIESVFVQTALALAQAMDAKDTYTADHAERLATMSLAVGRELGLSPRELEDLRFGATLHDVGKIGVPDAILQKPARLTRDEWHKMRRHPAIGEQILAPVPRLAGAARIVRHHHERYDGAGYPDGLAGDAIPLGARILAVVDSYSAIIDHRVYKHAQSHKRALAELQQHAGAQFDPHVVAVFLRLFENP